VLGAGLDAASASVTFDGGEMFDVAEIALAVEFLGVGEVAQPAGRSKARRPARNAVIIRWCCLACMNSFRSIYVLARRPDYGRPPDNVMQQTSNVLLSA